MSNYVYPAELIRVTDGDTCVFLLSRTVEVDFGFRFRVKVSMSFESAFRLADIDAPELKGKTKSERTKAEAARQFLDSLLKQGIELTVESQKPYGPLEADKYGRWLAIVYIKNPDGSVLSANVELISSGHAVPYDGKGPRHSWGDVD